MIDQLRKLSGLLNRDVSTLEDYRVGSPLLTIVSALQFAPFEDKEDHWVRLHEAWCDRYGSEAVDAGLEALHTGTLVFDPHHPIDWSSTRWR